MLLVFQQKYLSLRVKSKMKSTPGNKQCKEIRVHDLASDSKNDTRYIILPSHRKIVDVQYLEYMQRTRYSIDPDP